MLNSIKLDKNFKLKRKGFAYLRLNTIIWININQMNLKIFMVFY